MKGAPANPMSGVSPSSRVSRPTARATAPTLRPRGSQRGDVVGGADGVRDARPSRDDVEVDRRLERDDDVGEEDGGVDLVPPHRLHRDLADQFGVEARFEHADAGPDLPVLGQGAAGLAHEPHGRWAGFSPRAADSRGAWGRILRAGYSAGAADPTFVFSKPVIDPRSSGTARRRAGQRLPGRTQDVWSGPAAHAATPVPFAGIGAPPACGASPALTSAR